MEHLVNLDGELLREAMNQLGTRTIKDTVNGALEIVTERRRKKQLEAIEALGKYFAEHPFDRSEVTRFKAVDVTPAVLTRAEAVQRCWPSATQGPQSA